MARTSRSETSSRNRYVISCPRSRSEHLPELAPLPGRITEQGQAVQLGTASARSSISRSPACGLELGRPLLRATNDGVTALVDARGQEQARLPRFEPDVLTGTVQPRTGFTPFGRSGSWPTVVLALGLVAGAGWASRRGRTLSR